MLRRLHHEQPESFAFTPANRAWAEAQMTKFPEGRQASAIIPLLWRAQEQEGWLSRPAIEHVASMLGMAYIRALEVATFYFMFQLQPVGRIAHIQVCGTTSCMICGAEDLIAVCKDVIAPRPHQLSASGDFSWEEVECLGACANAPMAQIGKDYYEDLTAENFRALLERLAAGEVPVPGSQAGRFASEPAGGATTLTDRDGEAHNGSVALAVALGDTVKRIDGSEVPLLTPWQRPAPDGDPHPERDPLTGPGAGPGVQGGGAPGSGAADAPEDAILSDAPSDGTHYLKGEADAESTARPRETEPAEEAQHASATTEGDDPRVGRQEMIGEEPTVSETKPADSGEVAEGRTGRGVPDGVETRAGTTTGNAEVADGEASEGRRPQGLDAPQGEADDLKRISGVGPKLEGLLHSLGIWHFRQIASWGADEVAWMDSHLEGFRGRVTRDDWVSQARTLADGNGAPERADE